MVTILLYSMSVNVAQLTYTGVIFFHDIRYRFMRDLDERLRPKGCPDSALARLYGILRAMVTYSRWLLISFLLDIVLNVTFFITGLLKLLGDRYSGHSIMDQQKVDNKELQWGFGQIVPLIFCILPFMAAIEAYRGMCHPKLSFTVTQELSDEYITLIGHLEEDDMIDEVNDQTEIVICSGALYSEPETIEPSDASITSQVSANSTTPVGSSSAVAESHSVLEGGGAVKLRSLTFPNSADQKVSSARGIQRKQYRKMTGFGKVNATSDQTG